MQYNQSAQHLRPNPLRTNQSMVITGGVPFNQHAQQNPSFSISSGQRHQNPVMLGRVQSAFPTSINSGGMHPMVNSSQGQRFPADHNIGTSIQFQ
jgi:hypothetical protein